MCESPCARATCIYIYIYIERERENIPNTSCACAWALTQTKNPIMSICELTHIIAKPVNVQVNLWTRFAWGLIRLARFAQRESLGPIPLAGFAWLDSLGPVRQGPDSPRARFAQDPIRLDSFAFAAAAAAAAATAAAVAAAAAAIAATVAAAGGIAIASLIFLEPLAEHFPFRTPFLQTPMYLFVDLIIIYATRRLASNI